MHFECSTILIAYTQFVLANHSSAKLCTFKLPSRSLARKHKSCWQHSPETNQFDFDCSFYGLWHLITLFASPLSTLSLSLLFSILFFFGYLRQASAYVAESRDTFGQVAACFNSPYAVVMLDCSGCSSRLQSTWLAGWLAGTCFCMFSIMFDALFLGISS